MTKLTSKLLVLGAAFSLVACTATGNVERNAAKGAAIGAVAGAVIGNNRGSGDAGDGAETGAIVGAVAGALYGAQQDRATEGAVRARQPARGEQLYYDSRADRYYYIDPQTGRSYWQNGTIRG